ncbi:zinc finger BED domain-containing protein 5-like [Homalodisca vitripennis]|uniref:zinc finger BED domain-containing protein 5-like n=1 Tax=Homalodisca vitripennis TaxID=197043 RepID=UPI001EEA3E23|nr:zinc finger BED domain-containing protein 5-like [Homalodisca vitripennis]
MENVSSGQGNKKITMASYQLSLLIAKNSAPHTAGENLILPGAKIISSLLLDEKSGQQIGQIPLSNTTVKRRIEEMSANVKEILISAVKESDFYSLQLDESTDIADNANLLCFVRFNLNGSVEEDILFCHSLKTSTTGQDIFNSLDSFIREHGINWSKCVGLTTDGARAMSGKYTGLVGKVKEVAPLVEWTHCSIHREALAVKGMNPDLKSTLDDAVKIVNLIKAQSKNTRMFAVMCDEMGSDHKQLLLHCEVRWLSRGKVLSRLFELRDEVRLFLVQIEHDGKEKAKHFLCDCLNDETWLIKLSYLADIFSSLNILNLTLQGEDVHRFFVQDKVDATIKKIDRWHKKVQANKFDAFPLMNEFVDFHELTVDSVTSEIIIEHLQGLSSELRRYFPPIVATNKWIQNPFDEDNLKNVNLAAFEHVESMPLDRQVMEKPEIESEHVRPENVRKQDYNTLWRPFITD